MRTNIEREGDRYDLNHKGVGFDKVAFAAEAAVRISAGLEASVDNAVVDYTKAAEYAFDRAEALWEELCKRFPDDSEGEPEDDHGDHPDRP